ncbi:MAG: ABC transporter ATP-binding protein, partial [Alphaproteobacteria bacterium]
TGGEIWIDDTIVNELEPKDRDIAMVFQDYALYPHMSVYDNMAFSLQYRGYDKAEIRKRVLAAAEILNISELLHRRPKQLSGGQRQRVAMGRAIVRNPKVFLFDEPLSNLDAKLRVTMRSEIKKLHRRVAATVVYVTHDQVEAMTLADRIVVMQEGNIEQIGAPDTVYEAPATIFVAGFIGAPTMNLLQAKLIGSNGRLSVRLETGLELAVPPERSGRYAGYVDKEVIFGLRPESFDWNAKEEGGDAVIRTVASEVEPLGSDTLTFFKIGEQEVICRLPPKLVQTEGDPVSVVAQMSEMHLFDPATGKAV